MEKFESDLATKLETKGKRMSRNPSETHLNQGKGAIIQSKKLTDGLTLGFQNMFEAFSELVDDPMYSTPYNTSQAPKHKN